MATGVASQLAGPAGMGALRVPLLAVTVAVALAIVGLGVSGRRPRRAGRPVVGFGDFTVPIGLAVVGSGLARLGGPGVAAADGVVAAAWIITGVLAATVVVPVTAAPPGLAAVGGTWFLAPAALLADAIGAGAVAGPTTGHSPALGWLAVAAAGLGIVGYLAVMGVAAVRVVVHRVAGVPRAPWWIAAGCGGLSAAAVGRISAVDPLGRGGAILHGSGWVALGCWVVGGIALVPVLAGSLRYLVGLRRLVGRPPWPPTFSTGVYALGAGQVGRLLGNPAIVRVGEVAAVGTIGLWLLTVVAHLPRLARHLPRFPGGGPDAPCRPLTPPR